MTQPLAEWARRNPIVLCRINDHCHDCPVLRGIPGWNRSLGKSEQVRAQRTFSGRPPSGAAHISDNYKYYSPYESRAIGEPCSQI